LLKVLTLSTLYPDATRPRLGPFVERQTRELAGHSNVELHVVSPIGLPPWPFTRHSHYDALTRLPLDDIWEGVFVHRPRFLHLPGTGGRYDVTAMIRTLAPLLTALRREFVFDVIDAEYFFPDGPAAIALGQRFGVPVSIKARGSDIHVWGQAKATAAQVREAGLAAEGLLAVSPALKADMVAMGMPPDRIAVHYTGVDKALFGQIDRATARGALGISTPLIASVGTLTERKGHAVLIEALALIPGATLVIAGHGPDRDALDALARSVGVSDRVRFLGSIDHAAMALWLAAADVFALATASEGLANVWVEALASGTPVVTTNVGGAPDVIRSDIAGRLVARTAPAFAAAISDILASSPDPQRVKAEAAPFDWTTNRDALYAHLTSLVTSHSPRYASDRHP
jgi:teichuronic acid biosynthesis glycosyltransferase TuaC